MLYAAADVPVYHTGPMGPIPPHFEFEHWCHLIVIEDIQFPIIVQ